MTIKVVENGQLIEVEIVKKRWTIFGRQSLVSFRSRHITEDTNDSYLTTEARWKFDRDLIVAKD